MAEPNGVLFRLLIYRNTGDAMQVFGDQDIMHAAVDEWRSQVLACCDSGLLTVHGITDCADRSPATIVIRVGTIESMTLTRWF